MNAADPEATDEGLRETAEGLRLFVDGAPAAARWQRRQTWDLALTLEAPLPGFRFGSHVPQASRPNRGYLDERDGLTPLARDRLVETMTVAVRAARLVLDHGEALREAFGAIGAELRAVRTRVVPTEIRAAALAEIAAAPGRGPLARWRNDLRRARLDDRHARWQALLREIEWNFAEHVASRLGVHPPGALVEQMRGALGLRAEEVAR